MNTASSISAPAPNPSSATSGGRLQSLDAYRGLIMFTLLCGGIFQSLKAVPGWRWLADQNEHVEWRGCVYWDLIQPSFMYMVGVSMPFALGRRAALGDSWGRRFRHVLARALGLTVLGILLDHFGADHVQIGFIRVLQQIAIAYVITFLVAERCWRVQAVWAGLILVVYQLLWMFNPWNGPGGPWAMSHDNLGSAFDQWMLGRYYSGYYVGTNAIPSAATLIFGVMAGSLIRSAGDDAARRRALRTLAGFGAGGVVLGFGLGLMFPIIKRIWTPSFAVYAAGWTTLLLAGFYGIIEIKGWKRWCLPLQVVGMNSTAAYVLGNAFGGWFRSLTGAWISVLKPVLGDAWFPVFQHLAFALTAWGVLLWLYRRKLFFKL